MNQQLIALKGDIVYSVDKDTLVTKADSYLLIADGICQGIVEDLLAVGSEVEVVDYTGKLLIPGLVDLHMHAPQYAYRGLGMDLQLLEWLEAHAFLEESKYKDVAYAKTAYSIFVEDLKHSATTRASIFATIHAEGTKVLMDLLEDSGLITYVGKVNMDRNSPDTLREGNAVIAKEDTSKWVMETVDKYERTHPILTPRFTPSCTDELMEGLKDIQKTYHVPLQSHLSENQDEVAWVASLCPNTAFYGEAYSQFELFGGNCRTIMAHCVQSGEEEIQLMKENGVFIAHCPQSNLNVRSGIAPIRRYLEEGLEMGLGSDIAGGSSLSIFRAMTDAIQSSKMYQYYVDQAAKQLNMTEAFYLATKGGGAFFGKVGSFEAGYEADVVVIADEKIRTTRPLTLAERLERTAYLANDTHVVGKYVAGKKIF